MEAWSRGGTPVPLLGFMPVGVRPPPNDLGPLAGQRGVQSINEKHCEGKPHPFRRIVLGHPACGIDAALGSRRLGQDFVAGKGNADFPLGVFPCSRQDCRGSDGFRLLGSAFYGTCFFGPIWTGNPASLFRHRSLRPGCLRHSFLFRRGLACRAFIPGSFSGVSPYCFPVSLVRPLRKRHGSHRSGGMAHLRDQEQVLARGLSTMAPFLIGSWREGE